MGELAKELVAYLKTTWHRRSTGVLTSVIAGVLVLSVLTRDAGLRHSPWPYTVSILFTATVGLGWWLSHRPERTHRGRVGFVLALSCEDDFQERRIRADLISALRKNIEVDAALNNFQLIAYPRWLAERVVDQSRAAQYLGHSRAHFIVFGRVRVRESGLGESEYYVDLEGAVRHRSADEDTRSELAKEFSDALPKRIEFPNKGSVVAFELTSDLLEIASRYIIGLAAAISGDFAYAERLLLSAESRMPQFASQGLVNATLPKRLKSYLDSFYAVWSVALYSGYFRTRDPSWLPELDRITDKLLVRQPKHYNGRLSKAICEFLLRRNVPNAKRALRGCSKATDATWRYSRAFLLAYEGDLKGAESEYERAFKSRVKDKTVPVQSEEFIQGVLVEEPQAGRLHYCSALINYHAKSDYEAAEKDLQAFLAHQDSERFPHQVTKAKAMIARIGRMPDRETVATREVDYQLRPLEPDDQ